MHASERWIHPGALIISWVHKEYRPHEARLTLFCMSTCTSWCNNDLQRRQDFSRMQTLTQSNQPTVQSMPWINTRNWDWPQRAVRLTWSSLSTCALCCSNRATTDTLLFLAAKISAVHPTYSAINSAINPFTQGTKADVAGKIGLQCSVIQPQHHVAATYPPQTPDCSGTQE